MCQSPSPKSQAAAVSAIKSRENYTKHRNESYFHRVARSKIKKKKVSIPWAKVSHRKTKVHVWRWCVSLPWCCWSPQTPCSFWVSSLHFPRQVNTKEVGTGPRPRPSACLAGRCSSEQTSSAESWILVEEGEEEKKEGAGGWKGKVMDSSRCCFAAFNSFFFYGSGLKGS